MSVPSTALELPASVTTDMLRSLEADAAARAELLRQITSHFEGKYQCSLETFERKLENLEVPEHPGWEESIEWRNAVEQLERIEMSRSIFAWLIRWLAQYGAS
ncbi:MAG: hypothetical protein E3J21_15420 [Anaerolineales bacterium]|nr:MAG: hypothetical protein E3J21_15420 [Anaerolineales bacterium]